MSDPRPRIILQAHATRSAVAQAVLLHARDRGPRDARRPFATLIVSLVLGAIMVIAAYIATRLGAIQPR